MIFVIIFHRKWSEKQSGNMIKIGIDAGVNTGFAKMYGNDLVEVKTYSIIEALQAVEWTIKYASENGINLKVFIEDARKRKWIAPQAGKERLQGVGSVKRDSKIWQEFCVHYGIDFELVAPKNNKTKTSRDFLKKTTGWTGRTSEHARDAVMLVWGRTP